MEKKKLYLIFTTRLDTVGGAEMYTAGKSNYLKKLGWQVQCFSLGIDVGTTATIPFLDEYVKNGNASFKFLIHHPYNFRRWEQEFFLQSLIDHLEIPNPQEYEIIIETQDISEHFWGELLAQRLGARHFCIFLHEVYNQDYNDNVDFYYFKWKRNELITNKIAVQKVFRGYKNVTDTLYPIPDIVREMSPIQDVPFPMIDKIPKSDWNICHIGRIVKNYVPYVIGGVAEFARRHSDKKINFLFVGNILARKDFIIKTFKQIRNVSIVVLGDMVPIPRILLNKVNVVCAIAQSARFAANEGIPTIVGNADYPNRTPGLLGYDTLEQTFGEIKFSYTEALENVLVKRLYDNQEYQLPKLKPAEEYYKNFWTIVEKAAPTKEYYVERLSQERIRNWTAIFPFGTVARGARIILCGETEIARDYRRQIKSQENTSREFGEDYIKQIAPKPYCKIVATVDEHPENFDDSVVGMERLKQKDYDVIVITTYPQQAQDTYNKIVKIVPEMANRIIYNFNTVQI